MNCRNRSEVAPENSASGSPSASTSPWWKNITRVETSRAKPISWVTTSMVRPSSASARMTRSTSPTSSGSSAEVGSSNSITFGRIASARALLHVHRRLYEVLQHRQMRPQVEALEHHAELGSDAVDLAPVDGLGVAV